MHLSEDKWTGCVFGSVCTCFSARLPMIRFHFSMGESILPTFTCWEMGQNETEFNSLPL